ncbi:hypothetical protein, partial [Aeromonas piscicola]|uniref:hypothetical protein n=1 Tax=Aeromonas piscicola TaxID=600645 RepID=UPI0028E88AD6
HCQAPNIETPLIERGFLLLEIGISAAILCNSGHILSLITPYPAVSYRLCSNSKALRPLAC